MNDQRPPKAAKPTYPLAELRCHIEGAAPPDLVFTQAQKYCVDVSDIIRDRHYIWQDFTSFLSAYGKVAGLFRTAEDYACLTETYLGRIAEEGCLYAELFVAPVPPFIKSLAPEAYLEGVLEGVARAETKAGIIARLIVVGIRHEGPEKVMEAARFAARHQSKLLTGFGMAGDERMHHPKDFKSAFDFARDHGLHLTVHAGELMGPESVAAAIQYLNPSRIGHGVRAIEDQKLVDHLAESGITLECCPGSNIALGLYPTYGEHPIIALRDRGVKVTISSDDPPFFKTSLLQDYLNVQQAHGLDAQAMTAFTKTAIKAAFTDPETVKRLIDKL